MRRLLKWIVSTLYGLVMIEVLIMVSPFAFYWYSLYAPTLETLHRSKATAWMEAFFLPHAVITTSPLLEFLRWQVGAYCFSLGILVFLFTAIQLYSVKLFRRSMVNSWLYARIRHPQYLCLAIAGFGLLTIWPRIIILILYLGMLFAYYFLARFEEKNEEARHPEYADYRRRTAMFIPCNPGGKLFRLFFAWIPKRGWAVTASTVAVTVIVIGGGLLLRRYTIAHASKTALPGEPMLAISVWPMPAQSMRDVVSAALADSHVQSALAKEGVAAFTAHLLPANYGMTAMFADPGGSHRMFKRIAPRRFEYLVHFILPFTDPHRRNEIMGSPEDRYRVVFSRVDGPGQAPISVARVTGLGAKMTPVVIADVDGGAPRVEQVTFPPRRSFWGDITMPMF